MQPCEQMHDYMFIIYGSNVLVLYFVKVYTFLILKVLLRLFFLFVHKCQHSRRKKKNPKWNETSLRH